MIPRFLAIADELDKAERNMRDIGYSDADIADEMERIRARHAKAGPAAAYSALARNEKAHDIALVIWRGLDDGARRDVQTGFLLAQAGETFRNEFAKMAGHARGCSAETWALVVREVCQLVNAERRAATLPCPEGCAGGEVAHRTCSHSGPCPCGREDVRPCERCDGTGLQACECCGAAPATLATPLGFYCARCEPEAY